VATKFRQCARDPVTGQFLKGTTAPKLTARQKREKDRRHKRLMRAKLEEAMEPTTITRDSSGRFAPTDPNGNPMGAIQLKRFLEKVLSSYDKVRGKFNAEILAEVLFDMAVADRNTQAIQEIFNRIDGRVIERHEVEQRIPVTIVFKPAPEAQQLPSPTQPIITIEPVEVKDSGSHDQGSLLHSDLPKDERREDPSNS